MVELSAEGEGLWRQAFAGDVFNTLWYARAASNNNVDIAFHTALGTDPLSNQLQSFVHAAGIDCSDVPKLTDRRPGLYSIQLDGAERSFTYWRDTSAARMMMQHPDLLWAKVEKADIIYLSGITLAILPEDDCSTLLDNLRSRKPADALIAFDPNIRPHLWEDHDRMRRVIAQAAALSDIVMPSFDDEKTTFGDADPEATANRYHALGADHVVVKSGPEDTVHLKAGKITTYPVKPVDGVVDTTAAGDSFNGAYLAALLDGASTQVAITKAQVCAGQVICNKGALIDAAHLTPTPIPSAMAGA
jgi:2-dehydro-3-deoxygluconokinase